MANAFEVTENFQADFNQGFMDRLKDFNQDDVPPVILASVNSAANIFSEVSPRRADSFTVRRMKNKHI